MRATLDAPYADARADALSFALGLPPLDALAVLAVEHAGLTVELRLLGASHQVIAGPLSETVACLPGGADPLPGRASTDLPGWAYDFAATTAAHSDATAFGRAVEAVCARLDGRGDALTGDFPGSRHAVTALALEHAPVRSAGAAKPARDRALDPAVEETGIGWRTWHAYPQTREIVMTRSRLVRQREQ
ncbi:DUF2617 family protein [Actinomadura decatromicini]|uniref:DUF2617 family protein n=1 Tax=Actinomadura decatromicini TaxID=2604572 RepID=A0A5D3FNH4_9ACTN|nr:DUF2617 family protein [Actinomadura decatromicini]TYK49210.1 DUF2617 family protein [Actinomadura decatromicini]